MLGMIKINILLFLVTTLLLSNECEGQKPSTDKKYSWIANCKAIWTYWRWYSCGLKENAPD